MRTSQGRTALMLAAFYNRTACVQALVAAKAALDITSVSKARLFACPVTLESPSTSKSRVIRVIRIKRDVRVTRLLFSLLLLLLVALYHCNSRSLAAQRLHDCNDRKSPALARV